MTEPLTYTAGADRELNIEYSHPIDKHGGWNKRGGWDFLEKTST